MRASASIQKYLHKGCCPPIAWVLLLLLSSGLATVGAMKPPPRGGAKIGTLSRGKEDDNGSVTGGSNKDKNNSNPNDGKRRGKLLEDPFDEHDLLRAYEEIKSEYYQKVFGQSLPGCENAEATAPTTHQQKQQREWKVLCTMNPNKKKKRKPTNDDEIIRVSMLEHPSDPLCPYVKMETVIPMPVQSCWDFLSLDKWDETMPRMDPFYEGLDIYGEYSVPVRDETDRASTPPAISQENREPQKKNSNNNLVKMILARKRTKRILAFGKREFVFVSVEDVPLKDGTWVSGTVSVEVRENNHDGTTTTQASRLKRHPSYTRAFQDSIAFYQPVRSDGGDSGTSERTRLTIVCRIDLNDSSPEHTGGGGGCIPMWLYVKTIGITGARSVQSMRQCLLEGDQPRARNSE